VPLPAVLPDRLLAVPVLAPLAPDVPPAPVDAVDVPVEVALAAPVLPPRAESDVVADPVVPEVVAPVALAEAAPDVPPPAEPDTLPELPDVAVTESAPDPPEPDCVLSTAPNASPVSPDVPQTEPPLAPPLPASTIGADQASPLSPLDAPPDTCVDESPLYAPEPDSADDDASPELPPYPLMPDAASASL
jgi:hypothetical protein